MANTVIQNVIRNLYEDILKKDNVVGAASGIKITKNIRTDEECITIFVSKKVDKCKLKKEAVIPGMIKNIKTDVIEIGEVKALALTDKIRPAIGGYCIGPEGMNYSGTLGCLVADKNNLYILSNNHVLANSNMLKEGAKILQPSVPYGGKAGQDTIARLTKFVPINFVNNKNKPINYMDAAIAKITNKASVSNLIYESGAPLGVNIKLSEGDLVKKSGMTTKLTYGKVLYNDAYVTVSYNNKREAVFANQIITTSMISPGDSGSILLDSNNFVSALGFAGSDSISIFTPINVVLKEFGIVII